MKRIKNKKSHWNYRIVTHVIKGGQGIDLSDLTKNKQLSDLRVFSVTEVYYKDGKPNGYPESINILENLDSVEDIKWIRKKLKSALKKHILDLDNFPNEYEKSD